MRIPLLFIFIVLCVNYSYGQDKLTPVEPEVVEVYSAECTFKQDYLNEQNIRILETKPVTLFFDPTATLVCSFLKKGDQFYLVVNIAQKEGDIVNNRFIDQTSIQLKSTKGISYQFPKAQLKLHYKTIIERGRTLFFKLTKEQIEKLSYFDLAYVKFIHPNSDYTFTIDPAKQKDVDQRLIYDFFSLDSDCILYPDEED